MVQVWLDFGSPSSPIPLYSSCIQIYHDGQFHSYDWVSLYMYRNSPIIILIQIASFKDTLVDFVASCLFTARQTQDGLQSPVTIFYNPVW